MQISVVVFDGCDELDVIGPYRVFKGAADAGADLSVELAVLDSADSVTMSNGLRVEPDGRLETADPNLVLVPGGGWNDRTERGAWAEAERQTLPTTIARFHDEGITIAAVCTGTMLLATAGLTDGRPAVTHAAALDELDESGADVVDARVVDDGDIVTAGGVTSGIDLALYIVSYEFGDEVADAVATTLEYEPRGPIERTETGGERPSPHH